MLPKISLFFLLSLVLIACQPTPQAQSFPTEIPFPTMTMGYALVADLPPREGLINENSLANPATVEANVARPSPTPNLRSCPAQSGGLSLAVLPDTPSASNDAIANFLTLGGSLTDLEDQMINDWGVLGTEGFIRSDSDMTGEGTPEIIVSYTAPGDVGALSIFTCSNGQYLARYEITSDGSDPPLLTWLGDINGNGFNDLVYSAFACDEDDTCEYTTQIVTWERERGRFVNLVDRTMTSFNVPTLNDIDNDDVAELVLVLDSRGTSATGPLRTGVNIYDWNGSVYTLSIIQLDPPRYRVQLMHEADRLFGRLQTQEAAILYREALQEETDLRYWFNDGPSTLIPYGLYRAILVDTFNGDFENRQLIIDLLEQSYPINANTNPARLPVYVEMAYAFLSGWDSTNNLSNACGLVQNVIESRPEAIDLLNRYGSRSPQYTPNDLCPF